MMSIKLRENDDELFIFELKTEKFTAVSDDVEHWRAFETCQWASKREGKSFRVIRNKFTAV